MSPVGAALRGMRPTWPFSFGRSGSFWLLPKNREESGTSSRRVDIPETTPFRNITNEWYQGHL